MPAPRPATAAWLPLTLTLALAPAAARSESATGCHCFRDRTFEPARPSAADPYILATTRSSLLSAAYGIPKAELVGAVMTGTSPEDLWVAHYAAARLRRQASELLALRGTRSGWKETLFGLGSLGERFDAALARDASAGELASIAVEEVLVERARARPEALRAIRSAGASTEETVVATVLSATLGTPVLPLVTQVKEGRATWGSVLDSSGISPGQLDGLVRSMVR